MVVVVGGRALETTPVAVPVQHWTRIAGRSAYQFQALALGQRSLAVERLYVRYPAFYINTQSDVTVVQLLYLHQRV